MLRVAPFATRRGPPPEVGTDAPGGTGTDGKVKVRCVKQEQPGSSPLGNSWKHGREFQEVREAGLVENREIQETDCGQGSSDKQGSPKFKPKRSRAGEIRIVQ